MKRKVQAQRKFAQGAYIPQPNHNNNLPARDHTITPTKEDRGIVHHNIQAKQMLDIVSFQNIHLHKARVLLKRLEESPALNGHAESPSEPPEKRATPISPPEPVNNTLAKDESSEGKRSSVFHSTTPQAKNSYKTRGSTDRTRGHTDKTRSSTDRTRGPTDKTRSPIDRTRGPTDKTRSPIDRTRGPTDKTRSPIDRTRGPTDKTRSPIDRTRGPTDKTQSPTERTRGLTDKTRSPADRTRGPTVKKPVMKQKNLPERLSSSDDEFPLNHFKSLAKLRQERNSKDKPHKENPQKSSPEKLCKKKPSLQMKKIIGKTDRITRSGKVVVVTKGVINKGVIKNQGKIDSFFMKTNVKRHLVGAKTKKNILKKNKLLQNGQSKVINSLKTLSVEVTRETSHRSSNTESAVNQPESAASQSESAVNQAEGAVNQHVYLDLLPSDSPHVIQLTSQKTKNQKKQMMRARLIPKSQAKTPQDLSLVQNEPILGALLQTYNLEKRSDEVIVLDEVQEGVVDISSDSDESTLVLDEVPARRNESSSLLHGFDTSEPLEAPTFQLTEEEFDDPIAFFKRIAPLAAKFGVCKIVAPPNYDPKCVLSDDISFRVTNQYIARLYSRWGPAMREMCAIKACLASQNTMQFRSPSLENLELNLPKLHRLVQRHGGLSQVMGLKKWNRVADEMRVFKNSGAKTLERISMRTLLPYDALSAQERQQLLAKIERGWNRKNQKLLEWAINPLHRQKKLLGGSDSEEDDTDEDSNVTSALKEAEDCIVKGKNMNLDKFRKVADNAKEILLGRDHRTCSQIEEEYWRMVLLGTEHVCVNTASIDTGKCGYGFPRGKNDAIAKHPWNLKMVSQNSGNVLRSLGMVVGATVPTLHLGMVFSTSCWHRDPHGLPWLEYMHEGPPKIWYGIPDEQSANFRKAVETLCPTSCQNKSIWLPSDITMIPPELLRTHGVKLARVEQNPREYIMVFPKAYSCSICTGYTVSESVYFATDSWLKDVDQVFQELRESCEPTTFSLEQLLMSLVADTRSPHGTLLLVRDTLVRLLTQEAIHRAQLTARGLAVTQDLRSSKSRGAASDAWNDQEECDVCRTTLYLSKVTFQKGPAFRTCPEHALRLLDLPRMRDAEVSQNTLTVMVTQEQLDQCLQSLQKIAHAS